MGNIINNERGLLPYSIIIDAKHCNAEAMRKVLQHYDKCISNLSRRKLYDEWGNTYYGIDEDIQNRLKTKLMLAVLLFKI